MTKPSLFAISDLHLAFGNPDKEMSLKFPSWKNHWTKIAYDWKDKVTTEDIVVICGDVSWSLNWKGFQKDLEQLESLPGHKVIIPGNHDYWFSSLKKMNESTSPHVHFLSKNAMELNGYLFFGARLWDTPEYSCNEVIDWDVSVSSGMKASKEDLKKYQKELQHLKISIAAAQQIQNIVLKQEGFDPKNLTKICLTHFPPCSPTNTETEVMKMIRAYNYNHIIFGHLHSVKKDLDQFGPAQMNLHLTSCDYLNFTLKKIC